LTVGCARCHDHKFDPIPTADYYSMEGIFKSSKTMENFNVVANKQERNKLTEHLDKVEAKTKEIGRVAGAENNKLVKEARAKAGAYLLAADDVLLFEKSHLTPAPAGSGIIRKAASFDVPSGVKGPYFAEFDVTAPRACDYQLDMLEERGKPPVTNHEHHSP
jgi:Protein of unknown function (DUF1549)